MPSILTAPIQKDIIKVSYANRQGILVENVSVSDANEYEKRNPGTTFLFLNGDNKYQYLNIDQVNSLTPTDLISKKTTCNTTPKPSGPPRILFFGGEGIGAVANPIISPGGVLLGIDVVNSGIGYQTPPTIRIIDDGNIGSGAVVEAIIENNKVVGGIVLESGSGYIPTQQPTSIPTQQPTAIPIQQSTAIPTQQPQIPKYPVLLGLKEIVVNNPGINYNPGVDVVEITPNNGAVLQAIYTPFGQIVQVKVIRPGIGFINRPNITIRSESGVNADFTPVFEIIRDPQIFDPQIQQRNIITVIDTVGLEVRGYVNGKPYYGNVYYDGGVRYAGPYKTFSDQIRVYDSLSESIK
jgi:hypothetical protein